MLRNPLRERGAGNLVTGLVSGRLRNSTGPPGTHILAQASGPQIPALPAHPWAASQSRKCWPLQAPKPGSQEEFLLAGIVA